MTTSFNVFFLLFVTSSRVAGFSNLCINALLSVFVGSPTGVARAHGTGFRGYVNTFWRSHSWSVLSINYCPKKVPLCSNLYSLLFWCLYWDSFLEVLKGLQWCLFDRFVKWLFFIHKLFQVRQEVSIHNIFLNKCITFFQAPLVDNRQKILWNIFWCFHPRAQNKSETPFHRFQKDWWICLLQNKHAEQQAHFLAFFVAFFLCEWSWLSCPYRPVQELHSNMQLLCVCNTSDDMLAYFYWSQLFHLRILLADWLTVCSIHKSLEFLMLECVIYTRCHT